MKVYRYVGPKGIADRVAYDPMGARIGSRADLADWLIASRQDLSSGSVIATFVVDAAGALRIADRRSEHVACAGGNPVRSAGEMTFTIGEAIEVEVVSKQSTGYCPEPGS